MNKQILLLMLLSFFGSSVKAALPGIAPEVANILAGAADQVNQAVERAEQAEAQLVRQQEEAYSALARVAQAEADKIQLQVNNDVLLADAAKIEIALRDAAARADRLALENEQLTKKNSALTGEVTDFFQRLQNVTHAHEAAMNMQSRAQHELEKIRAQKEKSDREVADLMSKVANMQSGFSTQRYGMMSVPKASPMAAFDPSYAKKEQQKKSELQVELQKALSTQTEIQNNVERALEIIQEKDQEIAALNQQAVLLEEEKQEFQAFKDATRAGFDYIDREDIADVQAAAAFLPAEEMVVPQKRQTNVELLLDHLHRMVIAAREKMTSK